MPEETVTNLEELKQEEYAIQTEVNRLRREVFDQSDPSATPNLMEELVTAEDNLDKIQDAIRQATGKEGTRGLLLDSVGEERRRNRDTTGLEATVYLRMAQVPTSYYHLLDPGHSPLLSCEVYASDENEKPRRVRVTSFIDGYSALAVNSFEVAPDQTYMFNQLPTLFLEHIRYLNELTRATLNIKVEDLDGNVETHETYPIWLLARTTAPLQILDPKTGQWTSMKRYLGAFVTPNAPSLMGFLREAAAKHPSGRLAGYQGVPEDITPQIKAIFDALKEKANITYVNSVLDFSPDQGFNGQRVRLPKESLEQHQANCIDGTVLFASLLEGISLSPAIILVPGHAFVAWETWRNSDKWKFLETTMIGNSTFEQACQSAEKTADRYMKKKQLEALPLRQLRSEYGIFPME